MLRVQKHDLSVWVVSAAVAAEPRASAAAPARTSRFIAVPPEPELLSRAVYGRTRHGSAAFSSGVKTLMPETMQRAPCTLMSQSSALQICPVDARSRRTIGSDEVAPA